MSNPLDPLVKLLAFLLPASYHSRGEDLLSEEKHSQNWQEDIEFHQLLNPEETYEEYRAKHTPSKLIEAESQWAEIARRIVIRNGAHIEGIETIPVVSVGRKLLNASVYRSHDGQRVIVYEQGFGAGFLRINIFYAKWSHGMATGNPDADDLINVMRYILKYGRVPHPLTDLRFNLMPSGCPELKLLATHQSLYQVLFAILHELGHLHFADSRLRGKDDHAEEYYADAFAIRMLLETGDPLSVLGIRDQLLPSGFNWNEMTTTWLLWSQAILWNVFHVIETLCGVLPTTHPPARSRWARIRECFPSAIVASHSDYISELDALSDQMCTFLREGW